MPTRWPICQWPYEQHGVPHEKSYHSQRKSNKCHKRKIMSTVVGIKMGHNWICAKELSNLASTAVHFSRRQIISGKHLSLSLAQLFIYNIITEPLSEHIPLGQLREIQRTHHFFFVVFDYDCGVRAVFFVVTHEYSFSIFVLCVFCAFDDEILDVQRTEINTRTNTHSCTPSGLRIWMTDDVCTTPPTSYAFFTLSSRSVNVIIDAKMIEVSCGSVLFFYL